MVTMLPVWHITERAAELCMFSRGCKLVYSSVKHLKGDLAEHRPHWMMLVPRVLEKISSGVQDKFSKKGALARIMIHFFMMVASARRRHSKVADGLAVADRNPNFFRRLISRCVATALSPIDALGNRIVWNKVKEALGGRQKLIMSGGSALSGKVEDFFEQVGVLLVVGYGLTECSPLLCHRRSDSNLIAGGCVGHPVTDTEIRVVDVAADADEVERKPLPHGCEGLVLAKGKQVMKGYYKNPDATAKAIDRFGWFNTEDLGHINPATGDLFINGRAKDTIVLSNGENIEPVPIEDALLGCKLIDQVVLAGQDEKRLGAIVVLNPQALSNKGIIEHDEGERLQKLVDTINDPHCLEDDYVQASSDLMDVTKKVESDKKLMAVIGDDVKHLLKNFRPWEQVGIFTFLLEPFAMVNGLLTQSYKVKRAAVLEQYWGKKG
jgi:long-chain acyl-CoA synthetase